MEIGINACICLVLCSPLYLSWYKYSRTMSEKVMDLVEIQFFDYNICIEFLKIGKYMIVFWNILKGADGRRPSVLATESHEYFF